MKIKINERNFKYWFFLILLTGPLFMLNFHDITVVFITFLIYIAGLLILTLFYVIETKQNTIDKLNEEIVNLKKNMKTKFWVSFSYGAWKLIFTKTVDLPFAPFIGLMIMDDKDVENLIQLNDNEYCRTTIMYDLQDGEFDVDVSNIWKQPVREDVVDDILEKFNKTGWKREDNTNVEQFKKLMRDNYEKTKRIY